MLVRSLALLAALGALSGCHALSLPGMTPAAVAAAPFYQQNALPEARVRTNVAYLGTGLDKHRLDLYLPEAAAQPAPVVVFVHGGGWNSGDRAFGLGGNDLYANAGRYFARHGVLAAVISYRLLPDVDWRAQTDDVAAAVAWVRQHAAEHGGDARRLFLMGHSAGAQLAARVALDPAWLAARNTRAEAVCGVFSLSGAGFDLTHYPSIKDDYHYFATRFAPPGLRVRRRMSTHAEAWQRDASPALHVRAGAPPFVLMTLAQEAASFRQQAEQLRAALVRAGSATGPVETVPGGPHSLGAVLLSRPDLGIAPRAVRFVQTTPCAR